MSSMPAMFEVTTHLRQVAALCGRLGTDARDCVVRRQRYSTHGAICSPIFQRIHAGALRTSA